MRRHTEPHDQHQWKAAFRRLAPLIDGVEYFAAARSALIGARRQAIIVGWELHSELDLLRGDQADRAVQSDGYPTRLADLLRALVEERQDLEIYLLIWEGTTLFALEREHLPRMKLPWEKHPRIRLEWDTTAPPLASHHQKMLVVDDALAFVGGMDLTKSRWDTHEHRPTDHRRKTPGLIPHYSKPYHDAMLALDGPAARTLGGWCRERWRRATNEELPSPEAEDHDTDVWPPSSQPMLRDGEVSLALTQPEYAGRPAIRQVERSFLDQIARAERLIYIESQYLAARAITDALASRLREPGGPEIIVILPYGCPFPVQSAAMDTARDNLLAMLREADPGGRFGVYWPTLRGGSPEEVFRHSVYVHAKILITDDQLLRIGSANLNNRSMGLDSELDAFVSARTRPERDAIAALRRRLLAYLLHTEPQRVADAEREQGSVLGAIESLRGGEQTLHPLDHTAPAYARAAPLTPEIADPDHPLCQRDVERALHAMAESLDIRERAAGVWNAAVGRVRHHRLPAAIILLAAVALVVILTPLREVFTEQGVQRTVQSIESGPLGAIGVLAAFVLLGALGVPITLLIAAVGLSLHAWWAFPVAYLGVIGGSIPGFALGRAFRPASARSGAGGRARRLLDRFRRHGVLGVAIARSIPVAPFAVFNIACGAARISWTRYIGGSAIGVLPGVALLTLFGTQVGDLIRDPSVGGVVRALATGAGVVILALLAGRVMSAVNSRRAKEAR